MPRASQNSPRPTGSVGDRSSLYWSLTAQFVFRMTSERNDAGNTQSHSRGPTSSRNSSLSSENGRQNLQLLWQAAGLAMFSWGSSLQGQRRPTEAKIDRLLSEQRIDQPSSNIMRTKKSGAEA